MAEGAFRFPGMAALARAKYRLLIGPLREVAGQCGYALGVHAHHESYAKPLEVIWLCQTCHGERHREINEERRRAA